LGCGPSLSSGVVMDFMVASLERPVKNRGVVEVGEISYTNQRALGIGYGSCIATLWSKTFVRGGRLFYHEV